MANWRANTHLRWFRVQAATLGVWRRCIRAFVRLFYWVLFIISGQHTGGRAAWVFVIFKEVSDSQLSCWRLRWVRRARAPLASAACPERGVSGLGRRVPAIQAHTTRYWKPIKFSEEPRLCALRRTMRLSHRRAHTRRNAVVRRLKQLL